MSNTDAGTVGFWEKRCEILERALELAVDELYNEDTIDRFIDEAKEE